jgi:hypothetical protein
LGGFSIEREAPCDHGLKVRKFVVFEGTNRGEKIECGKEVQLIFSLEY